MAKYRIQYVDCRMDKDRRPLHMYVSALLSPDPDRGNRRFHYSWLSDARSREPELTPNYVFIHTVNNISVPLEFQVLSTDTESTDPVNNKRVVGFVVKDTVTLDDFELEDVTTDG